MSLDATRWAWQQLGLRPTDKLTLLALADRASEQHQAWPSIDRLRLDTGLDRHTLVSCISRLVERGLLGRQKRFGAPPIYTLIGVPDRHQNALGNANNSSEEMHTNGPSSAQNCKTAHSSAQTHTPLVQKCAPSVVHKPTLKPISKPTSKPTSKNTHARARFQIPTIEEVREYCRERNNQVDPEKFHAYYTSNGWRVGRNAMKDWKAAVRTWEGNSRSAPTGGISRTYRKTAQDYIDESNAKLAQLEAEEMSEAEREVFGERLD